MTAFELLTIDPDPRIVRLTMDGVAVLQNSLGRDANDFEIINIKRKAAIVVLNERAKVAAEKLSNERVTGQTCPLGATKSGDEKIENARFVMPADGKYMVVPRGEFPHAKGLVQCVDDESMDKIVSNFQQQKKDPNHPGILIDKDHLSQTGSTAAVGWITNLEKRHDGVWANIAWTDDGKKEVAGGNFRYVSPVFRRRDCIPVDASDKTSNRCRPVILDSLAITNSPNMAPQTPLTKIV